MPSNYENRLKNLLTLPSIMNYLKQLEPDEFEKYVREQGQTILMFATKLLNKQQLHYLAASYPSDCLCYAPEQLSLTDFNTCVQRYPKFGLQFASDRLSEQQLKKGIECYPDTAIQFVPEKIPPELLLEITLKKPKDTIDELEKQNIALARALYPLIDKLPPEIRTQVITTYARSI